VTVVAVQFLPRCMECRRGSDENSVCLSVCPSVIRMHCDETCEQVGVPLSRRAWT